MGEEEGRGRKGGEGREGKEGRGRRGGSRNEISNVFLVY